MANPTQTYKWVTPSPNDDPWDVKIGALWDSQDTTVHSVELLAPNRVSVVISLYPTAITCYGAQATIPAWIVMSQAAFGRLVGSFSLVRSGAQVMFTLGLTGFAQTANLVASFTNVGPFFFRGVVQPGSISIPSNAANFTADSAWQFTPSFTQTRVNLTFQSVTSLGPGNYSVELQHRGVATATSSIWVMGTPDWLVLTAREGDLIT